MENPQEIWLAPNCNHAELGEEGRLWSPADEWGTCPECGEAATRYILAEPILFYLDEAIDGELMHHTYDVSTVSGRADFWDKLDYGLTRLSRMINDLEYDKRQLSAAQGLSPELEIISETLKYEKGAKIQELWSKLPLDNKEEFLAALDRLRSILYLEE